MVLWDFLKQHAGEENMLHCYHCTAALMQILGIPDPDSELDWRPRLQWARTGEDKRQQALDDFQDIVRAHKWDGDSKVQSGQ